ncbi:hypothetical protein SERLA73DRAFT_180066, partial [Serpula lacrymans var. lacrymans S7.3]
MVNAFAQDSHNEFIVISDSDSDITKRKAEREQLERKSKLRRHQKTSENFLDNELKKIQKENESLRAKCVSQKIEIERLQITLKQLTSQGDDEEKKLTVIESRSSVSVKPPATSMKVETS